MTKNSIKKLLSLLGITTLVASPIIAMGGGLLSSNSFKISNNISEEATDYILCDTWEKGSYYNDDLDFNVVTWTWTSNTGDTIVLEDLNGYMEGYGLRKDTTYGNGTIKLDDDDVSDGKLYYLDLSNIEFSKFDDPYMTNVGFKNCNRIYGIKVPDTIDTIPYGLFVSCQNLKEIEMPGVKFIGEMAFKNCTALQEITLPEGYEVLDAYDSGNKQYVNNCNIFSGCTSLRKITLPSTLTKIAQNAFVDLSSLQEVVFTNSSDNLVMDGTTFGNDSADLKLYFNTEQLKNTYTDYIQGRATNNYGWNACGLTYSESLVNVNPNPPSPDPSTPSNSNVGLIAGIAGGIVGAILLVVIITLIAKKVKAKKVMY